MNVSYAAWRRSNQRCGEKFSFSLLPEAVLPRVSGAAPGLWSTGAGLEADEESAVPHIYGNQTSLMRQTCDNQEDVLAGGKTGQKMLRNVVEM